MRGGWFVLVGASVLAAGCSVQDSGNNQAAAANEAVGAPEGPSLTAQLFGGGKPMPLSIQQPLANGTVIQITSIQVKPTETVLGVKIVNGHRNDVKLNWSNKKTYLTTGGQKFYISPPTGNEDLAIAPSASLEGELVFLGAIPKEAGAITFVINEGLNNSQYSNTPGVNIPLNVTSAAWSDDGSKKNLAA